MKDDRRGSLKTVTAGDRELASHLAQLTNAEVECRSGHHEFALDSWHIGKAMPDSVYARYAKDGCFDLVSPCPNCGARLIITTQPGGHLHGDLSRHIEYPGTWYHLPMELPHGKRTLRRELFRRGESQFRALIARASSAEQTPPGVPVIQFRGA